MSRNALIGIAAALAVGAILVVGLVIGGPSEGDTGGLAGTTEASADATPATQDEAPDAAADDAAADDAAADEPAADEPAADEPAAADGNGAEPLPKDGPAVPDVGGIDLVSGEEIRFQNLVGKPTIVQMWASWCHVCDEGAGSVKRFSEERGDINYIGIDVSDTPDNGRGFIDKHDWTFPNVDDSNGSLAQTFGLTGTPTFVFVHADGTIAGRVAGDPGYENLNQIADRLIASI